MGDSGGETLFVAWPVLRGVRQEVGGGEDFADLVMAVVRVQTGSRHRSPRVVPEYRDRIFYRR
ncbi:hypothetical protein [Streptomyces sp. NPDC059221]|uniref:hypothetical protein n=1 Tax=Streptomyces sp. NPDC059221 TaxID=3346774 RepID=UPI0036AADD33